MWINDIETAVFSRIKARGSPLKKYFPKIFFTTENETDETVAVFPTVYVEKLAGTELGRDLDNRKTNLCLCSFQINISHNGKKNEVERIMENCKDTLKQMRFDMENDPVYSLNKGVWTGVARFRRVIGGGDIL